MADRDGNGFDQDSPPGWSRHIEGDRLSVAGCPIMRQHHGRMDGSGYPQGLLGEEMILEARILAVAYIVEAMASRRPYRPSLGIDKELEEIFHKKPWQQSHNIRY